MGDEPKYRCRRLFCPKCGPQDGERFMFITRDDLIAEQPLIYMALCWRCNLPLAWFKVDEALDGWTRLLNLLEREARERDAPETKADPSTN